MDDELIRDYLSNLAVLLPGPVGARAAILAELGDGLADAVDDHVRRGCAPLVAARMAVDEFGDPALLAARFTPILAARQIHRCALGFLGTGPLIGGLWLTTALLSAPQPLPAVVVTAMVVVGMALLAAVPCAVFAVATTGRWLAAQPRPATDAVLVTAGGAIVGDLVLLAVLGAQAWAVFGSTVAVLAGLAATASIVRLVLAGRTVGRLRHLRAVLPSARR